jgi:hypothetical protein
MLFIAYCTSRGAGDIFNTKRFSALTVFIPAAGHAQWHCAASGGISSP